MSARVTIALVAIGLSVFAAAAVSVRADGWPTVPPLPAEHPVPGWVYELTYDTGSGKIISVVAYDPSGPPFYGAREGRTASITGASQAILEVSKEPDLAAIMTDVDAFYVEVGGFNVKPRSGYSGPSSATPASSSSVPLEYLPPLLLGLAAGTALLTRWRWKR